LLVIPAKRFITAQAVQAGMQCLAIHGKSLPGFDASREPE